MEDIEFSGLAARYSAKGRTGYNPIMMYALVPVLEKHKDASRCFPEAVTADSGYCSKKKPAVSGREGDHQLYQAPEP